MKIDNTKIYFHGSRSKKLDRLNNSSFRYPFYATPDIGYAVAFAGKAYSSCTGDRKIEYGDKGYVYRIDIDSKAELFDFRTIEKDKNIEKKIRSIISDELFDTACDEYRVKFNVKAGIPTDVWMFGNMVASIVYDNMHKFPEISRYIEEGEAHEALTYIFERLDGFSGVVTNETDWDPYTGKEVSTGCSIGLWDSGCFKLSKHEPIESDFIHEALTAPDSNEKLRILLENSALYIGK